MKGVAECIDPARDVGVVGGFGVGGGEPASSFAPTLLGGVCYQLGETWFYYFEPATSCSFNSVWLGAIEVEAII